MARTQALLSFAPSKESNKETCLPAGRNHRLGNFSKKLQTYG
jgi:hypothetical protein